MTALRTGLDGLDKDLFLALNDWGPDWLDATFVAISYKWYAIPLYALLAYLLYRKLGWKRLLLAVLAIAIMITLSDQSANLFKKVLFQRPRPCQPGGLGDIASVLKDSCGGRWGFYSAHAANSFALAIVIGNLLKPYFRAAFPLMILWATLVAYSRVYIGVHYPGDVIAGTVAGIIFGVVGLYIYNFFMEKSEAWLAR